MSAANQSGATVTKAAAPEETKAPIPATVTHQEPQLGGSYTRNLTTGVLERVAHADRQPQQE